MRFRFRTRVQAFSPPRPARRAGESPRSPRGVRFPSAPLKLTVSQFRSFPLIPSFSPAETFPLSSSNTQRPPCGPFSPHWAVHARVSQAQGPQASHGPFCFGNKLQCVKGLETTLPLGSKRPLRGCTRPSSHTLRLRPPAHPLIPSPCS